ncbi:MAG: hypothetical protein PVJ39_00380 [Gammaproteobacteria bacterium]
MNLESVTSRCDQLLTIGLPWQFESGLLPIFQSLRRSTLDVAADRASVTTLRASEIPHWFNIHY